MSALPVNAASFQDRPPPASGDLASVATRIGSTAAAPAAAAVDRDARFPSEAIDALRRERMLSVLVPADLGGGGASIVDVAAAVDALGQHCASTAMVYAMHQIQVHCLVRHGQTPALDGFLRELAAQELLLASATTEVGIGGDVRSSGCALERQDGRFHLEKQAPVISYGANADGILATARASEASTANDQVLVLCRRANTSLSETSGWDTLGFRGTCSLGFSLAADGPVDEVLTDPFADIAARTMLPTSHIVWSSVWLGIATSAVSLARRFIRNEARKSPGRSPAAAVRLAELVASLQEFSALVESTARRYRDSEDDPVELNSMGFAIAMNSLKLSSSAYVVDIVTRAMSVIGISAYREDSPYSMGRLLRDAHGAPLMINNDRIAGHNAQMLLVHKGE
ncbi:MAG: acyl-CoA dehydrogenase [Acidimicrobiaceae bacterium]|jgi:acyl-CoA dehydrogenase